MADELEEAEDERAIELSSISAIYPETVIHSSDPFSASIEIRIEPIKPLTIVFLPLADGAPPSDVLTPPISDENDEAHSAERIFLIEHLTPDDQAQDVHHISHLPSLTLDICLPEGYPTQKAPIFNVRTASSWLPERLLKEVRAVGHTIWEDMGRDQVVFSYIDYLRDEADRGFGLLEGGGECLKLSQNLKIALLDFDLQAKRAKFEQQTFECGVCLGMCQPYIVKAILTAHQNPKRARCAIDYYCAHMCFASSVFRIFSTPVLRKEMLRTSSAWHPIVAKNRDLI